MALESLYLQERNSCLISLDDDLFSEYFVDSKAGWRTLGQLDKDETVTHFYRDRQGSIKR